MDKWLKRTLVLAGAVGALWLVAAVLNPFLEERIPAWKHFTHVVEEQGLDPGALYYTNVPQTQEAEAHMRQAVKEAMDERRRARQESR